MDPDLPATSVALRTVSPHVEQSQQSTPEKTPTLKWLTWAERLLAGCCPRIGVLDVGASAAVAAAAKTMGLSYRVLDSDDDVGVEPYDCVLSILPKTKYIVAFCYRALKAWSGLLPGGHMALVMREEAYAVVRRFLPLHARSLDLEAEAKTAYVWRKPIAKMLGGHKTRHAAKPQKTASRG